MKKTKRTKSKIDRLRLLHFYYKRTGFYPFLLNTTLKVIIGLGAVVFLLIVLEKHVISLDDLMSFMLDRFPNWAILTVFFIAESFLGLLPPDLFIIWSGKSENPWQMLTIVGTVSQFAGIMAYQIGKWLLKWDGLRFYIENKFANYLVMLNKWGGLLVILAALFPLPYGAVCTLAGIVNFPFRLFFWFNLTRYFRFYLYALILFNVL